MKKTLRIPAFILLLVLTISAFAGCNTIGGEDETKKPIDDDVIVDDLFPDIDKKDYGEDFNLFVEASNGVSFFYMDEEENDGGAMDEAVFSRQERVSRYLGVEFVSVKYPDASFSNYHTYVQDAVKNMDGTIDAVVTHPHSGPSNLISENLLADFSDYPGIDLDAEYWNMEFMDTLELNGNYFLGLSDYNLLRTYVIAFNKEMLDEYGGGMEKTIYDLVLDYEWTLDEMIKLANLVSSDTTGDGKTPDDKFGISGMCWVEFCGFLTSSDIPMVAQDQSGAYKVAVNSDKYMSRAVDLVDKLKTLAKSNSAYFDYPWALQNFKISVSAPLSSGRVLMQVINTTNLEGLLAYQLEFGVLPYPMYDLDQKNVGYKSLQWGGYIGIPSYVKNETKVGETLEMLAYYSENVKITFYEKLLGKRVADMPEDAAMLEIIWDSVATDVGQTFLSLGSDQHGVCYTVPVLLNEEKNQLASYVDGKANAINKQFKEFMDNID